MKVSIFCGGRGSATLIREFMRMPNIELRLLINAYDDGLSTGELRDFIPGMLGPSDFRKNLSYLLHLHSNQQYALTRFLEFRMPSQFSTADLNSLEDWTFSRADHKSLPPAIQEILKDLSLDWREKIRNNLKYFFEYYRESGSKFNFVDCSFGNLLFAGLFLKNNKSFNAATEEIALLFEARARLINVTQGENRILVALKENGEVLERESKIVDQQSDAKIHDIFLTEKHLSSENLTNLSQMTSLKEKSIYLKNLEKPVYLSPEAEAAIADSDIIIYGPGTQFSSLFPSYKTLGLLECVQKSRARLKAFILNIHKDHDIQAFSIEELLEKFLYIIGVPDNSFQSVLTHALVHSSSSHTERLLPLRASRTGVDIFNQIAMVQDDFESPARPGTHSGVTTVKQLLCIHDEIVAEVLNEIEIYVDLHRRSLAVNLLIQEFIEFPWKKHFKKAHLRINGVVLPQLELPDYLSVSSTQFNGYFSESEEVLRWAKTSSSKYLVTLTGDGEYRLSDAVSGVLVLNSSPGFGALYGSRNQSRRQFLNSLDSAYGESRLLFFLSWTGAFLISILFAIRYLIIFSDPLTGFRIYNRSLVAPVLKPLDSKQLGSPSAITKLLIQNKVEIAEIPVCYRTFKGFTNLKWRLMRGFKNLK